jgi:hypothetical protein
MNLPLVFDIALGLIFIYLILSLLAAEIQELLATLLQWRATHLKKSIEILLTGGEGTLQDDSIKGIVDDLYNNPLIRNINQESKEGIEAWFRQIIWQLGRVYRSIRNQKDTTFGKEPNGTRKEKRSAPSYIPSETFATTLLTRLNIAELSHKLNAANLINFKEKEIISGIETIIEHLTISEETRSKLESELKNLDKNTEKIFINFKTNKSTLINSINRMQEELDKYIEYIDNSEDYFTEAEAKSKKQFIQELKSLKKDLFFKSDELIERLQPRLTEIVNILDTGGQIYKELKEDIENQNSELYKAYQGIEEETQRVIGKLPKSVRESLSALAKRAQVKAKAEKLEQELTQFEKEIEVWFDRSMDRASGVYKRNAKGVAFLIGVFIAFIANADTFHIVSRLSRDTALRTAITQNAESAVANCPNSQLDCIRDRMNQTLSPISLPIGRSLDNIQQQEEESKHWNFQGLSFSPLKRILGWIVSGLAISMGAPFWFELLGKMMNVRNTGPKPKSSTEDKSSGK